MKTLFTRDFNEEGNLVTSAEEGMRMLREDAPNAQDIITEMDLLMILIRDSKAVSTEDYRRLNKSYQVIREKYEQVGLAPFQFPEDREVTRLIINILHRKT